MSEPLLDQLRAEVARLHQHALICLSCTPCCEAAAAFWALSAAVEAHAPAHLCVDPDSPTSGLIYGPGLPFGIDCPFLATLARELHLPPPPAAG